MKSQGPPGPRPKPRERASLQTEVRGVSEKVKLLEDILVAYVKAHGGLIKYLTEERNRSRLLSAVKNGKATEILKGAFREVDRAAARHRAMLARMHEINDGEAVLPEFHPKAVVLPTIPIPRSSVVTEGKEVFIPAEPPLSQTDPEKLLPHGEEVGHHRREAEKILRRDVLRIPVSSAESKLPESAEEAIKGVLEAKGPLREEFEGASETVRDILELKKAEIRATLDQKPVESAGKHPLDAGNEPFETKNDPDLAKKEGLKRTQELFAEGVCPTAAREMEAEKGDSESVRAWKESMIGKEP